MLDYSISANVLLHLLGSLAVSQEGVYMHLTILPGVIPAILSGLDSPVDFVWVKLQGNNPNLQPDILGRQLEAQLPRKGLLGKEVLLFQAETPLTQQHRIVIAETLRQATGLDSPVVGVYRAPSSSAVEGDYDLLLNNEGFPWQRAIPAKMLALRAAAPAPVS
ncbi:MAG: hypothetical protein Q8Q05_00275 [bacterium]|nr:hypothetical protein [bacterium]